MKNMKKKNKKEGKIENKNEEIKESKVYTIDELIELGKQSNCVEIAKPLFNDDTTKVKE